MFSNLLDLLMPQLKAIKWARVAVGVIGGLLLSALVYFLLMFVWVGRPQEFYNSGYAAGVAWESKRRDDLERSDREKIAEKIKNENQRRQKILSAPSHSPDVLLERMLRGDL